MAFKHFFKSTEEVRDNLALELATDELINGAQMNFIQFVERKDELVQELEDEGIDKSLMVAYLDTFCKRLK